MNKLYNETDIQATANAIRTRSGDNSTLYKVEDFADAINAIPRPSGSRTVTQNGTFNVADKEFVNVTVEGGGSAPIIESLTVTENGTYNAPSGVDGYSPVVVNVPSDTPSLVELNVTANGDYYPGTGVDGFDEVHVNVAPNLETKTIISNGTFTPSAGKDGFSSVTVNVPVPSPTGTINISENGTYDVTTYASANVNVSGGGSEIKSGSFMLESDITCTADNPYTITHNLGKAPKYFLMWYGVQPYPSTANGINQIDYINTDEMSYHTVARNVSNSARAYSFTVGTDIEINTNTVVIKNWILMAKGVNNYMYHWVCW